MSRDSYDDDYRPPLRHLSGHPKSAWTQGFEAAEFRDARGRRANPFEPQSDDWRQWEYGYGDYQSARAEMYEDNEGL